MKRTESRIVKVMHRAFVLVGLILISTLAVACKIPPPQPAIPTEEGFYSLSLFREYYDFLGGKDVLGPIISMEKSEGKLIVQYTQNAKLIFDSQAPSDKRFRLAPLGKQMTVSQPPVAQPKQPELRYVCGHIIYPDFVPRYEKIGARNTGCPLTEVGYSPARKRIEQYFENVGMYRLKGETEVHLLAYGVMWCDADCRSSDAGSATIDVYPQVDPTFEGLVNMLGMDFTGFALSEAYTGPDGHWLQIFANVVLEAKVANDLASVQVRPIAKELSIPTDVPKTYSGKPDMYFLAGQGNLGYEIPPYFWDYILKHGDLDVSGSPISHLMVVDDHTVRQCLANSCLIFDASSSESGRVHPEELGYSYKLLYHSSKPKQASPTLPGQATILQVWETYPSISSTQQQGISVLILQNNDPMVNAVPVLVLKMPDGSEPIRTMPPTGADGKSTALLQPIQASNGSLIFYKICLVRPIGDTFCAAESFIIWNNP